MLSVITITFNNFQELSDTLSSLPGDGVESVVVNGGSCEKTKDLLLSHRGPFLSEKDQGISDAFNKGFDISTGEYITYLNSGDQLIDQNYYREAVEYLKSHSEYDFVYADICFVDQYAGKIHVKSNLPLPNMPYLHPTLIVRRKVMEAVGPFNLEYKIGMDLDFVYRMVRQNFKGHYIPRMVVKMDGRGVSSKNHSRNLKEVFDIVVKYRDFNFRTFKYFAVRFPLMMIKIMLIKLHFSGLIASYRRKKYSSEKLQDR